MPEVKQASPALVAAQDAAFDPAMTDHDRQHLLLNLTGALLAAGWDITSAAHPEGDTITIRLQHG